MRNRISIFIRRLREDQRSPNWQTLRDTHLELNNICAWCGSNRDLEVHHIKPFHLYPELELEPRNLVTLCESIGRNCHLERGHLGSWRKFNPLLLEEIEAHHSYPV